MTVEYPTTALKNRLRIYRKCVIELDSWIDRHANQTFVTQSHAELIHEEAIAQDQDLVHILFYFIDWVYND